MTQQAAIEIIKSQINKADSYNFQFVQIKEIKDARNEVCGHFVSALFTTQNQDTSSNYSIKMIVENDGSITKL